MGEVSLTAKITTATATITTTTTKTAAAMVQSIPPVGQPDLKLFVDRLGLGCFPYGPAIWI